jgi:hypothetical protein
VVTPDRLTPGNPFYYSMNGALDLGQEALHA